MQVSPAAARELERSGLQSDPSHVGVKGSSRRLDEMFGTASDYWLLLGY